MGERKTWFRRSVPALVLPLTLLLSAALVPSAGADDKKPSTPFEGFSSDSDKPVNITAEQLEMHNEDQMAIFTGNVVATQGDSVLNSDELTVYYEAQDGDKAADASPAPAAAATPAAAGGDTAPAAQLPADAGDAADSSGAPAPAANKVKRLLAKGHVVVTSKDQKATGDDGDLDMQTNIATLTGQEVILSQGCNVLKGRKLVVDTKTGLSTVTGGTTGHFVSGGDATKC
jgi:lipopolysaccharide export system protein LptA